LVKRIAAVPGVESVGLTTHCLWAAIENLSYVRKEKVICRAKIPAPFRGWSMILSANHGDPLRAGRYFDAAILPKPKK